MGAFSIAEKLDRLFHQARAARPGQPDASAAEPSYMAVAEAEPI